MRHGFRFSPAGWAVLCVAASLPPLLQAQNLEVRMAAGALRLSAPRLHFIEGRVLERLRNGASVPVHFLLSISASNRLNVVRRASERVVLSYDLWEEKYAVAGPGTNGRPVAHTGTAAAEAWCYDLLSVKPDGLPEAQPLWLKLEVRADDPEQQQPGVVPNPGNLRELIEVFSRTKPRLEQRWVAEAGPFRIEELKRRP